jgi:small-conductance mechanosensitive channel
VNVIRIAIIVVGALIILQIWGVPTTPILILILVIVLAAALALRNAAPNLFAGFQLSAAQQIKVGDYIKLETGEEGHVTEIGWSNTHIRGLDESTIVIPNSRLFQSTVINYGRPLKKAKEPFHFHSRTHLTELTGLKAKNLRELVDILKKAPDTVIYHHTHHFLEQHHYLTPEPSNDFAVWVNDALGDEVLGEGLASVDTFAFPNMEALRERLVGIIEEHLSKGSNFRDVMPDREFHFAKSVSIILPTPYIAHDLREFVEALRKISLGSLYFHIFESRLRLGRGLNDFSIWMKDSLGETELGEEIARLDPYTYTLEGLRSTLIQLIEKRIK